MATRIPHRMTTDMDSSTEIDAKIAALFPVGSITLRLDAIDPATIYPGTWTLITGAAHLSLGDGTAQDGTVVGSNSATLTTGQLPSHTHGVGTLATAAGGSHSHTLTRTNYTSDGATLAEVNYFEPGDMSTLERVTIVDSTTVINGWNDGGSPFHFTAITTGGSHTHTVEGSTAAAGSAEAVNIQSARVLVNVWLRTA